MINARTQGHVLQGPRDHSIPGNNQAQTSPLPLFVQKMTIKPQDTGVEGVIDIEE